MFAAPVMVFALGAVRAVVFVLGQAVIGLAWTVVFPYFLDVQSALDKTGRLGVVGMLVAASGRPFRLNEASFSDPRIGAG